MPRTFSRLLGALVASAMLASGAVSAAALDQFKAFAGSTRAAKGEFTQQQLKTSKSGKAAPLSSGTFVFSRPGKFIWTYQKPYEQLLQADGEHLYIYDKDLNQVTQRRLGDALGSSPAAILFGSNNLEQNFTLAEGGEHDGMEWLTALPKARDTSFEQIRIGLRGGVPMAMELKDTFGQLTVIKFTRFERNPTLTAQQFRFTVPPGADLVRQ